jgi:hypothetical protein
MALWGTHGAQHATQRTGKFDDMIYGTVAHIPAACPSTLPGLCAIRQNVYSHPTFCGKQSSLQLLLSLVPVRGASARYPSRFSTSGCHSMLGPNMVD